MRRTRRADLPRAPAGVERRGCQATSPYRQVIPEWLCLAGGTWSWPPGKAGGWAGWAVSPGAGVTGGPTDLSPTWGAAVLAPELESDANGAVQLPTRLPGLRLHPAWATSKPGARLPLQASPLETGLPCVRGLRGAISREQDNSSLPGTPDPRTVTVPRLSDPTQLGPSSRWSLQ